MFTRIVQTMPNSFGMYTIHVDVWIAIFTKALWIFSTFLHRNIRTMRFIVCISWLIFRGVCVYKDQHVAKKNPIIEQLCKFAYHSLRVYLNFNGLILTLIFSITFNNSTMYVLLSTHACSNRSLFMTLLFLQF